MTNLVVEKEEEPIDSIHAGGISSCYFSDGYCKGKTAATKAFATTPSHSLAVL